MKRCRDPVCPANQPPSLSKRRTSKPRKKSQTKSDRPKRSRRRSRTKDCRNKKCQASRSTVESSTSVSRTRARSRGSLRSCRSKSICCKSRKKGCHCAGREEVRKPRSATKKRRQRRSRCRQSRCKKPRRERTPLCICVRGSSSQNLKKYCKCSSTCTLLSKYNDCCCIRNKRKKSKTGNNSEKRNSSRKCHCKPRSSKLGLFNPGGNILARGLSALRKKLQKLRHFFSRCENPRCNERHVCRTCPVQRCCSRMTLWNRNQNASDRRVKFNK